MLYLSDLDVIDIRSILSRWWDLNIFDYRDRLTDDYASYVESFIQIRDPAIRSYVQQQLDQGVLWPDPLLQLNPLFAPGDSIDELVAQGVLHQECARIFRKKSQDDPAGRTLWLHKHQEEAIRVARGGHSYVLTTGTGSGKSLAYIVPIVDYVLRHGPGRGIRAIVVYPMNALANSQMKELEKFLLLGYPNKHGPVTFARYTGQESEEERERIRANPPDILLTNYVMLELILTRSIERRLLATKTLQFLVLDELHTYRGRQGADVALLVRRAKARIVASELQCVGTSATLAGAGTYDEQRAAVAAMASQIFGTSLSREHVIGETLVRTTTSGNQDEQFLQDLTEQIKARGSTLPRNYQSFVQAALP